MKYLGMLKDRIKQHPEVGVLFETIASFLSEGQSCLVLHSPLLRDPDQKEQGYPTLLVVITEQASVASAVTVFNPKGKIIPIGVKDDYDYSLEEEQEVREVYSHLDLTPFSARRSVIGTRLLAKIGKDGVSIIDSASTGCYNAEDLRLFVDGGLGINSLPVYETAWLIEPAPGY